MLRTSSTPLRRCARARPRAEIGYPTGQCGSEGDTGHSSLHIIVQPRTCEKPCGHSLALQYGVRVHQQKHSIVFEIGRLVQRPLELVHLVEAPGPPQSRRKAFPFFGHGRIVSGRPPAVSERADPKTSRRPSDSSIGMYEHSEHLRSLERTDVGTTPVFTVVRMPPDCCARGY
eukprot:1802278-Prymnesium_polylepis.1